MFLFFVCFTSFNLYFDSANDICSSAVFVLGLFSLSALSGCRVSDVYSAGIDLILRSSPQTQ